MRDNDQRSYPRYWHKILLADVLQLSSSSGNGRKTSNFAFIGEPEGCQSGSNETREVLSTLQGKLF